MASWTDEFLIADCCNSINDNKYNAAKVSRSPSYRLKKFLRPLIRFLRASSSSSSSASKGKCSDSVQSDDACSWTSSASGDHEPVDECNENDANEALEARLLNEINHCLEDAAIFVYEDNKCQMQPVLPSQTYVPVHFARTEAGTFFWTTMHRPADCDLVEPSYCHSNYQAPTLQYGDRWVQA